jgi:glutamate synthase (NADPH/NADH) large chain
MIEHWKAAGWISRIFYKPDAPKDEIYWTERQKHPIDDILDRKLIEKAMPALENKEPVDRPADHNVDRSAGAMLSGEVAKRYGHKGLPDDTISVKLAARPASPSVHSSPMASPST